MSHSTIVWTIVQNRGEPDSELGSEPTEDHQLMATQAATADLEHLVHVYAPDVMRFCMRRASAEDAREAAAETFAIAWRRNDRIPEGEAARYWLYSVARKVLANQHRSKRRRRRLRERLAGLSEEPPPSPETVVVRRAEDQEVLDALSRLKRRDREVLRLVVWEELSREDAAVVMELSVEAVHKRYQRAVKRLEHELMQSATTSSPQDTATEWGRS